MTRSRDALRGVAADAVQALVDGRHGDPFAILGPHDRDGERVVRALLPGARGVEVVSRETAGDDVPASLGVLDLAHPGGLFAGHVQATAPYRLRIAWDDAVQETEDPYAFGLLLGELDLHLIAEGTHYEIGRCLGAQPMTVEGVDGVRFAVWAPHARRVSVVGDFNVLGRTPASDAAASRGRHLGAVRAARRGGNALQVRDHRTRRVAAAAKGGSRRAGQRGRAEHGFGRRRSGAVPLDR